MRWDMNTMYFLIYMVITIIILWFYFELVSRFSSTWFLSHSFTKNHPYVYVYLQPDDILWSYPSRWNVNLNLRNLNLPHSLGLLFLPHTLCIIILTLKIYIFYISLNSKKLSTLNSKNNFSHIAVYDLLHNKKSI